MTVPTILYFIKQTVGTRGRFGGPQGYLPEQSSPLLWSRSLTFQLQVVVFREFFKVFPKNGVQQRLVEQNIVFQQRLPSRTLTFQFPEVARTVSLFLTLQAHPQYCVMCVGTFFFFAFFPGLKKVRHYLRTGSALPPHSSPWTPAAYDVPMVLEEEEEESEEELVEYVEYMEFDGCWWGCEWVPARQQHCWWLAAADGSQIGTRSGGPPGSSCVDQRVTWSRLVQVHGLVDCVRGGVLLYVPWWKVHVTVQPSSSSLCRLTDSGWCLFRSSTECPTLPVCYRDRSAQRLLCRRPLRFHSCSSWPSLSCPFSAMTSFGTDSAENSGTAAGAAPVVLWRHCDHTAYSSSPSRTFLARFSSTECRTFKLCSQCSSCTRLLRRLLTTVAHGPDSAEQLRSPMTCSRRALPWSRSRCWAHVGYACARHWVGDTASPRAVY